MKMPKTASIGLRTYAEIKEAAEKAAMDDQRTLASLVEKALVEYLKKEGYLT